MSLLRMFEQGFKPRPKDTQDKRRQTPYNSFTQTLSQSLGINWDMTV